MQRTAQLIGIAALVLGFASQAKAFGVGADLGYSRILVQDGEDSNGFGGDLYIRPLPLPIIDPELQLGLHRFSSDAGGLDQSFTIYPLMAGARLELPFLPIMLGAHVGAIGSRYSVESGIGGPSLTDTNWDFGFNVGGGFNFLNLPLVSLGISAWYYVVPADHDSSPDFNMLTVGLDVGLGF